MLVILKPLTGSRVVMLEYLPHLVNNYSNLAPERIQMDRNQHVNMVIGELPKISVLLVDSYTTYCSLCGGQTFPDETHHKIDVPNSKVEGCGARFVAIAALNRYENATVTLTQMRNDLPIVELEDNECGRLQL